MNESAEELKGALICCRANFLRLWKAGREHGSSFGEDHAHDARYCMDLIDEVLALEPSNEVAVVDKRRGHSPTDEASNNAPTAASPPLERQVDELRSALRNLMPFVLEDYYPECVTPSFRSAVENAQRLIAL